MIGYVCKYTPIEWLEAAGAQMVRIDPRVTAFPEADVCMHPNMCAYVKSVLEVMAHEDYEGLVLTTCCDSVRRLYDVLKERWPDRFFYLLDVPRKVNDFSTGLYRQRIQALVDAWIRWRNSHGQPDTDTADDGLDSPSCGRAAAPVSAANAYENPVQETAGDPVAERLREKLTRLRAEAALTPPPVPEAALQIGLVGARCPHSLRTLFEEKGVRLSFDLTCTGGTRAVLLAQVLDSGVEDATISPGQITYAYAAALLNQLPCMRMVDATGRGRYLDAFEGRLDGIVYHTVKFCDIYSFEYARLHREDRFPLLAIDTDLTPQCEGQVRTRVEAFLESLQARKAAPSARRSASSTHYPGGITMNKIYVMGVDSGSTSTGAVIMNEKKEILADAVIRTGAKTSESASRVLEAVLASAGIAREDLNCIVSTGYGRVSIPYADRNVTEISCHAKGALYFFPEVRTILDIGGQDSKTIRLDGTGEILDFAMNDKCAAGTGRFLEAMARTLECGIEDLGPLSIQSQKEIEISSMCTVFAESEVISLIARNEEKTDIAAGVHRAIASKASSLLRRVGILPELMMTGGVARNPGVVQAIEEKTGCRILLCDKPDIVGAVGAALFALEATGASSDNNA